MQHAKTVGSDEIAQVVLIVEVVHLEDRTIFFAFVITTLYISKRSVLPINFKTIYKYVR